MILNYEIWISHMSNNKSQFLYLVSPNSNDLDLAVYNYVIAFTVQHQKNYLILF